LRHKLLSAVEKQAKKDEKQAKNLTIWRRLVFCLSARLFSYFVQKKEIVWFEERKMRNKPKI